jgi:hypothetical protein
MAFFSKCLIPFIGLNESMPGAEIEFVWRFETVSFTLRYFSSPSEEASTFVPVRT